MTNMEKIRNKYMRGTMHNGWFAYKSKRDQTKMVWS